MIVKLLRSIRVLLTSRWDFIHYWICCNLQKMFSSVRKVSFFSWIDSLVKIVHSVSVPRMYYCILQLQTEEQKREISTCCTELQSSYRLKILPIQKKDAMGKSVIVRNISYCFAVSIMQFSQEKANRTFYLTKNDCVF